MTKEAVKQIISDETFKFINEMEKETEMGDYQRRTMVATAAQLKIRLQNAINNAIETRQII